MKNIVLLIAFACIGSAAFTQTEKVKIKIKDEIAYLNGTAYLNWKKTGIGGNEISIWSVNSAQEEIYAMYLDYADPARVTKSNPQGTVSWIELNFLTLKKKCEIPTRMHAALAKFIYENNVYKEGILNAESVDILVQKYGMRFSENRPNGKVNIYINE